MQIILTSKMKILSLSSYFYPESVASTHLAKDKNEALVKSGNSIYVIAPTPCRGVSEEVRRKYLKKRNELFYNGKIAVHRFRMFKEGRNPIMRAIRYFLCGIEYYCLGVPASKKVDVITTGSTPPIMGAIASLIKKRTNKPIVYNLQDIFPDSLVSAGLVKKNGILWRIGRSIENFTYKNVDKIIVPSDDFKNNIMNKGVQSSKIEVIYNWIDEKTVIPIDKRDNPMFEELGIEREKFHVVYAGNLGYAQNVKILLVAAKLLKTENDIDFIIFGTGGYKNEYKAYVKKNELTNVMFFPLQPHAKVSQVYSLGDACLVSCKKGFGGCAMPSKTWSILSAGTPVLCSFDKGELQQIIEQNKIGLFSEADDVHSLVNNILTLYSNRDMCREYGLNGRLFVEKNLTKEVGVAKYLNIINLFDKKCTDISLNG